MAKKRDVLRTDLRDEIKTDPNGKIWRDRELDEFLLQAYAKVQADCQYELPENEVDPATFNTVSGTAEYTLPSNFGRAQLVYSTDRKLYSITKQRAREIDPDDNDSGSPYRYYIRGTKIGFYPKPNTSETIYMLYLAELAFPTDDTTEIDYDDKFARVLIKYAAYLAWSSPRGNKQAALEKLDDYKEVLGAYKTSQLFRDNEIKYKTVRKRRNYYNPQGLNYWR
jgi:hypothetical protein